MQADPNSWWVRWFIWNCKILDRFFPKSYYRRAEKYGINGTNLCHFFQTLFWGSLAVVLSGVTWAASVYVFCILPFTLWHTTDVLSIVVIAVALFCALIGVVVALVCTPNAFRWAVDTLESHVNKNVTDGRPGFLSAIWQLIVGVKNRFCPRITWKNYGDDANV